MPRAADQPLSTLCRHHGYTVFSPLAQPLRAASTANHLLASWLLLPCLLPSFPAALPRRAVAARARLLRLPDLSARPRLSQQRLPLFSSEFAAQPVRCKTDCRRGADRASPAHSPISLRRPRVRPSPAAACDYTPAITSHCHADRRPPHTSPGPPPSQPRTPPCSLPRQAQCRGPVKPYRPRNPPCRGPTASRRRTASRPPCKSQQPRQEHLSWKVKRASG